MNSKEIRKSFIDFFEGKEHRFTRSSSVIPTDDPTLLFTNAGMNQFKPIFLGVETPQDKRVVNSQKCIRVSGKHNDLEEVGIDTFHHTFFEMLGNWSFGDYYKAEAISWAWELFTEVWGLDKNRLWATVYEEDDEAFKLWPKVTDIDPSRVLKCGKKDNFWEMGETGPCGPCSEIHYFIGEDISSQSAKGVNKSDEYWELWNLVFIQNNRLEDGSLEDLPEKHVDTGAGLERIVTVLQNKTSNYETDLFFPLIKKVEDLTGRSYTDDPVPFQVIADHIRMLSFSIADGGMPSNEGRGYVLRRILRRGARFGRILNQHKPFMYKVVKTVGEIMGGVFPEVLEKSAHIENVIRAEESSFNETLDRGLNHFEKLLSKLSDKTISGDEAFKLYDTYGFPLDLTELMAREKGFVVDLNGFEKKMKLQKERAKKSGKFERIEKSLNWEVISDGKNSEFIGYSSLVSKSRIRKYSLDGENTLLVLDETPFYAESGGQIGDKGWIRGNGINLDVLNVKKDNDVFVHHCKGEFSTEKATGPVECLVDELRRQNIRKNHSATHLMHAALKQVLGEHVQQAGSLVHPDYLRFDLTHFEKITSEQLRQIEDIVNREIILNTALDIAVKKYDIAKKEGATALFGEKYGEEVRVVSISSFSRELCGGTHVDRTGDIGLFKITEESALAAGVRRLVAVTGQGAIEFIQNQTVVLETAQSLLNCAVDEIPERIEQILSQKKSLEKNLKQQKRGLNSFNPKTIVAKGKVIGEHTITVEKVEVSSIEELKAMGDRLLSVIKSGVGVLGTEGSEKPSAVVVVTPDLVKVGLKAGELARKIGAEMGGGGGGKAHLATAGGKNTDQLDHALNSGRDIIEKIVENI